MKTMSNIQKHKEELEQRLKQFSDTFITMTGNQVTTESPVVSVCNDSKKVTLARFGAVVPFQIYNTSRCINDMDSAFLIQEVSHYLEQYRWLPYGENSTQTAGKSLSITMQFEYTLLDKKIQEAVDLLESSTRFFSRHFTIEEGLFKSLVLLTKDGYLQWSNILGECGSPSFTWRSENLKGGVYFQVSSESDQCYLRLYRVSDGHCLWGTHSPLHSRNTHYFDLHRIFCMVNKIHFCDK